MAQEKEPICLRSKLYLLSDFQGKKGPELCASMISSGLPVDLVRGVLRLKWETSISGKMHPHEPLILRVGWLRRSELERHVTPQ